jgi:hypothetical protein
MGQDKVESPGSGGASPYQSRGSPLSPDTSPFPYRISPLMADQASGHSFWEARISACIRRK